jgi:hypothetical protein
VTTAPIAPPSRRLAYSDLLLCVVAGCHTRAVTKVEVCIGGAARQVSVCNRHARAHATPAPSTGSSA